MESDPILYKFSNPQTGDTDELDALVRGEAKFTSDISLPGQLYAHFVRSEYAHGAIIEVDLTECLSSPGVVAAFTSKDLDADNIGLIEPLVLFNGIDDRPMFPAGIPLLAKDKVRYVGEPIVVIVACSVEEAINGSEKARISISPFKAVTHPKKALNTTEVKIHEGNLGNLSLDWEDGSQKVSDSVFDEADHVVQVVLEDPPLAACSLEPRAAIASYDPEKKQLLLIAPTQGVNVVKKILAESVLKIDPSTLRVITPKVGGGFGSKVQPYSEYGALLFASRKLGRPIKWVSTRSEAFLSDTAGRNTYIEGELALDRSGKVLGLRCRLIVGIGAYTSTYIAIVGTNNSKNCLSSVYRIPSIHIRSQLVFTNTVPLGPYRGAGRPEALLLVERLFDLAAKAIKMDRIEVRRINMITPLEIPYQAANGQLYDSGDFPTILDKALTASDWLGFESRKIDSEKHGLLRGIGCSCFLEVAGGILDEPAKVAFTKDKKIKIFIGGQAIGQGHLDTFTKIISDYFGVSRNHIELINGDSDFAPGIVATVASRSMMMCGNALIAASDSAIKKGKVASAEIFEASASDIEYKEGEFRVIGTDKSIGLFDLVERSFRINDVTGIPYSILDSTESFKSSAMTFPNGCHICELEIDPKTGVVNIVRYTAVDDVGTIISQDIVDGQIMGAVVQGLGQVFGEQIVYDDEGQVINASLMDYPLLVADQTPNIQSIFHSVACTNNYLGVKGAGESGIAGAIPASFNAVMNALDSIGISNLDIPFTPSRIWTAIQKSPYSQ
jgi:carbon-monoxide dehydrogenase large subunit